MNGFGVNISHSADVGRVDGGMTALMDHEVFMRDALSSSRRTATVDFKREVWKLRWMCGDPAGDGEVSEFQIVEAALPILCRGRKSRRKIGRRWVGGGGERDVEGGGEEKKVILVNVELDQVKRHSFLGSEAQCEEISSASPLKWKQEHHIWCWESMGRGVNWTGGGRFG